MSVSNPPSAEVALTGTRLGDYLREKIFLTSIFATPGSELHDVTRFAVETKKFINFFIDTGHGNIGAWFMQPEDIQQQKNSNEKTKAVLYVHGVKGNRASPGRICTYNILLSLGYKVLAFDYRGFGDSSKISLDQDSVVFDTIKAYDWLVAKLEPDTDILVFAHSMGTAISSHALADILARDGKCCAHRLILMSPFNNFTEEFISKTRDSSFWNLLYTISGTLIPSTLLNMLNMNFSQDEHLAKVNCPVLVLHAEDDKVIPVALAKKLVETVKESGKQDVQIHLYDAKLKYGHSHIYKDANLPQLISSFMDASFE